MAKPKYSPETKLAVVNHYLSFRERLSDFEAVSTGSFSNNGE